MTFAALLDTCVLYPMYLRDSLLRLAAADLYRPIWSRHILDELHRALVHTNAATPDQATRMIGLMQTHFPESDAAGYEPLIPALTCHEKDRHVLAAAITSGATLLVTDNIDDFPAASTEPHGVEVASADQFLLELLDAAPTTVVATFTAQAQQYKREPKTLDGLLTALGRSGLTAFVNEVRRHIS